MVDDTTLPARIRDIIYEWDRGCSCAEDGKPETCPECTKGAIDAILSAVSRHEDLARRLEQMPKPSDSFTAKDWADFASMAGTHRSR